MKKLGITSLAIIASAFLGLGARTASARPCCSACTGDPVLNICKNGCTPTCSAEEEQLSLVEVIAAEAQVCYAAPADGASNATSSEASAPGTTTAASS